MVLMSAPRSQSDRRTDRKNDPNRFIYTTGLAAGIIFSLGFLAALLGAAFTGDFTLGGLLVAVLALVSAGLGIEGWRRRRVAFSWGALGWLLAVMALSQIVSG